MKKFLFIYILSLAIIATSCEDKHNHLGNLNGNWQLMSWHNVKNGELIADKGSNIYYSISISLMKIWRVDNSSKYFMTTFRNKNDSLVITNAYVSPFDSIVTTKEMKDFGIPEDGAFRIAELSSDKMTLVSNESILSFKKN